MHPTGEKSWNQVISWTISCLITPSNTIINHHHTLILSSTDQSNNQILSLSLQLRILLIIRQQCVMNDRLRWQSATKLLLSPLHEPLLTKHFPICPSMVWAINDWLNPSCECPVIQINTPHQSPRMKNWLYLAWQFNKVLSAHCIMPRTDNENTISDCCRSQHDLLATKDF
jgi:hypothetical protein